MAGRRVLVKKSLVVLIAFVAFHRAEIDETRFLDRVIAFLDFRNGHIDMDIRAVGCFELG